MKKTIYLHFLIGFLFVMLGSSMAADIQVYAAASLKNVLAEIATNYEKMHPDKIRFNLAASNVLALQIKEGAPADLFFSADEAKMDRLQNAGLIDPTTRKSLLSNTLVIVVEKGSALTFKDAMELGSDKVKRLALAEPQTVPAGIYAKQYLQKIKLWGKVIDRVIPTENVRAALAAVESGNVDAGIVYRTDALISKEVRIAYEISALEGPNISYPVALVKGAKNFSAATELLSYLESEQALKLFEKNGFIVKR
jgi:molybdate transport system substrate-binding protein